MLATLPASCAPALWLALLPRVCSPSARFVLHCVSHGTTGTAYRRGNAVGIRARKAQKWVGKCFAPLLVQLSPIFLASCLRYTHFQFPLAFLCALPLRRPLFVFGSVRHFSSASLAGLLGGRDANCAARSARATRGGARGVAEARGQCQLLTPLAVFFLTGVRQASTHSAPFRFACTVCDRVRC
jgi:hypothetical protein